MDRKNGKEISLPAKTCPKSIIIFLMEFTLMVFDVICNDEKCSWMLLQSIGYCKVFSIINSIKVKVKVSLEQATKAQRGSRGIAGIAQSV